MMAPLLKWLKVTKWSHQVGKLFQEFEFGDCKLPPGHQMLVEDQDGQKMVVVNPGPGEEPQTIVIPEQVQYLLDPGAIGSL